MSKKTKKVQNQPRVTNTDTPNGHSSSGSEVNVINQELYYAMQEMGALTRNLTTYQRGIFQKFLDSRRDIDKECGYPETEELRVENYKKLYEREPIATKVVDLLPNASWGVSPQVYETEGLETDTAFEEALMEIGRNLLEDGFYENEEEHPLWEVLSRADRLSGIGHYGAVLIGINDGQEDLSQPAELVEDGGKKADPEKLLYLRALDEQMCSIAEFDNDKSSRRYGRPLTYNVVIEESAYPTAGVAPQRAEASIKQTKVHWTRIVHLADNLDSSEVYGAPRIRPVYNRVYDLYKLYGGSAEMYWQGAFPGIAFELDPRLAFLQGQGNFPKKIEGMKDQVEHYMNSLQRYLMLPGLHANSLAPQVSDPSSQIDKAIEAICMVLECPKRIFMGSERGELSSSQDLRQWYDKVRRRQNRYISPRIIVPVINRLIKLLVLPTPKQYFIRWPDLAGQTDQEKSSNAVTVTEALSKYIQGGVDAIIEPIDYLTRVLKMDQEEAEAILESKKEAIEKEDEMLEFGKEEEEVPEGFPPQGGMPPGQDPNQPQPPQLPDPNNPQASNPGKQLPKDKKMQKVGTKNKEGETEADDPFQLQTSVLIDNVFCPTGKGGGIDPTCPASKGSGGGGVIQGIPPYVKEGLTPSEMKEYRKLIKKRTELNKKIKGGNATDAEKSEQKEVMKKLNALRDKAKKGEDSVEPDPKPVKKKKPTKKKEPEKKEPELTPSDDMKPGNPEYDKLPIQEKLKVNKELNDIHAKMTETDPEVEKAYNTKKAEVENMKKDLRKTLVQRADAKRDLDKGKITDEEYIKIVGRDDAWKDLNKKILDAQYELESLEEKIRTDPMKVLTLPDNRQSKMKFKGNLTGSNVKKVQQAQDFVNKVTDRSVTGGPLPPTTGVQQGGKNTRAHYKVATGNIHIAKNEDVDTIVHEMGHRIENIGPGTQRKANEFRRYRIQKAGTPNVPLSKEFPGYGYDANEFGNKDEFDKVLKGSHAYYAGKGYGSGDTEILSMGIETLYTNAQEFAKKDPEYFKFTVGALRGLL